MYFTIPDKAKPSKVASKDKTRPALMCANIRETDDGWALEVTDSYMLSVIPLTAHDGGPDNGVRAGQIHRDVLAAIEKAGCGGFAFSDNDTATILDRTGNLVATLPNAAERNGEAVSTFPNVKQLLPDEPNGGKLRIGLNPDLLKSIADAQGRNKYGPVILTVDFDKRGSGGEGDTYLRAIRVTANGVDSNVLMPMRIA